MNIQQVKQRFGIIGNSPLLDRALHTAVQVAPTDLSVLITGESGTGKEVIPQIIHNLSARKHNKYIAVNCGAIPEGTIDSELFGHEKGSFTGAVGSRSGYFEEADGGTIFLDEVAELPIQTQVRLLRVLESGEFLRVGSSKVFKTNVRIVAATNVNIPESISKGKFREDLFYRLNTVPIQIPSLRERREDIHLLLRKFASDFAEKYRMPSIKLDADAVDTLEKYRWPGNIRQLKNITEQISIIEQNRDINAGTLLQYLPDIHQPKLPTFYEPEQSKDINEREILYKFLFDMKKDLNDVKKLVIGLIQNGNQHVPSPEDALIVKRLYDEIGENKLPSVNYKESSEDMDTASIPNLYESQDGEVIEETLSLENLEIEMIKKALDRYKGKRKNAANELGISERTLYRKIKEYNL